MPRFARMLAEGMIERGHDIQIWSPTPFFFKIPLPGKMKKWLGYILSFYLLFNIIVPCSVFDKCEEAQQTERSSSKESKKDCNDCSPFCACSSAHGFTNNKINLLIEVVFLNSMPVYSNYALSSTSGYHSGFFQPPRLS